MFFSNLLQGCSNGLRLFLTTYFFRLFFFISACGPGTSPSFSGSGIPKTTLTENGHIEVVHEEPSQEIIEENQNNGEEISQDTNSPRFNDLPVENTITISEAEESSEDSLDAVAASAEPVIESEAYEHILILDLPDNTEVDILWVIDSSLSMAEEQEYLGDNFSSLIAALASSNQDFQTAITTTDICTEEIPEDLSLRACPFAYGGNAQTHLRGSFVGDLGRTVLSVADLDLEEKFKEYTNVGTLGSNFEHGLRASEMAIEKVLSGENENLLRDDAFLSVIIISDEEDDGVGLSKFDPFLGFNTHEEGYTSYLYTNDQLISYLDEIKGQGNFSVSTITGTRLENGELCTSQHSSPSEEGSALIDAATKTGGIVLSICDTDWGESLQNLGYDLNAQISQINLEKEAIESSIKVEVNGVEYNNWTFITGNNSIKFDPEAIPSPGSNIRISYNSSDP